MRISYSLDNKLIFDKEIKISIYKTIMILLVFSPAKTVRDVIELRNIMKFWFGIY